MKKQRESIKGVTRFKTVSLAMPIFGLALLFAAQADAQVNSGSNGSDGVLNPSTNIVIDMSDHPDGIYHYTSVSIPDGVTVSFIPNSANTPVVWLVENSVVIDGTVALSGQYIGHDESGGGLGGPGGFRGGASLGDGYAPEPGQGPGGGKISTGVSNLKGSYAAYGTQTNLSASYHPSGDIYGNDYLVPLIGGSGGSGGYTTVYQLGRTVKYYTGGSGGGGAILIVANNRISINGNLYASGGYAGYGGGRGSGGAIRLVTSELTGSGSVSVGGYGSLGRIRFDAMSDSFSGTLETEVTTRGFQPVIIPPPTQAVSLSVETVEGVAVNEPPTASPINPDVIVPANTQNPVTIVVKCVNIPLNTEVIVDAKPASGQTVRAVALNNSGTQALSYATVHMDLPRGAGTIQAKAVSGIADQFAAIGKPDDGTMLAQTGWLATGERFAAVEVTSALGGSQSLTYISESGKRYSLGAL